MKRIVLVVASVLLVSSHASQAQAARLSLPKAQAVVDEWYRQFLGRVPDPGAAGWVLALVRGRPAGYILADILSSPEYFARAGGTNAGFISQLYKDQLGRAPTAAELIFWTNLSLRKPRSSIAYLFLRSQGNVALLSRIQFRRRHRDRD